MRYQKQKTELNSYLAKVIFILLEIWISTVFENYFEYPKFEYPKSISNLAKVENSIWKTLIMIT